MKTCVRGAMGMALSISILTAAGTAYAYTDEDESVYDYFVDRTDASSSDLIEDEREIREVLKEAKKRASRETVNELKEELEELELERDFALTLQKSVRSKLVSSSDWKSNVEKNRLAIHTAITAANTTPPAGLKDGESKDLSSDLASYTVEGYPFKVIQKLTVKKVKDGEHKVFVSQKLELDESVDRSDWPSSMRRKFKDFSSDDMQSFLEKNVNKKVEGETYEVGELEELKNGSDKLAKAMGRLPKGIADHMRSDVFGTSSSRDTPFNEGINDRIDDLGDKKEDGTEIGDKFADLEIETDPKGRAERIADLQAKLDLSRALRAKSGLAQDKDPCEVILSVLKKDKFNKLSANSKMECAAMIKKKEAEIAERKEEETVSQEAKKEDVARNGAVHNSFMDLVNHCRARKQMQANQNTARPIDKLITPMYNALQARGAGCSYFGTFMGELAANGGGEDIEMAQVLGLDPAMMAATEDSGDLLEQARETVDRLSIDTYEGTKKVERQVNCLMKMSSLSGMALDRLKGTNPQGLSNPDLISDPKVRQMIKYNKIALALVTAGNEEIRKRKMGGVRGLKPLAGRSTASTGMNGSSSMGGTSVPYRTLNTSQSRTERGQPRRQQGTRRDSARGAGASRRPPPPNYLGN